MSGIILQNKVVKLFNNEEVNFVKYFLYFEKSKQFF